MLEHLLFHVIILTKTFECVRKQGIVQSRREYLIHVDGQPFKTYIKNDDAYILCEILNKMVLDANLNTSL